MLAVMAETSHELPTPVVKNGRFGCPWTDWRTPKLTNVFKWMLTSPDHSSIPSQKELDEKLPILKPDFSTPITGNDLRVTWLGHATVLIEMGNITFITDPMFSNRASPSQMFGTKRYRKAPCTIEELPRIDFVLISHNHYDHLDSNSVHKLNQRFGNQITWFVPLGLKNWMKDSGCVNVIEMNWWENHKWSEETSIIPTPAQHWSKRTATDDNASLWASWCVLGRQRFFFAGDTGYANDVFKKIGEKYGPFDLAAIPIGAYEPRWMMQDQHVDPVEAVQIHCDIKSKNSVGIHWATFRLTNEHYLAPREELSNALNQQSVPEESFFTFNHGESRTFSKTD